MSGLKRNTFVLLILVQCIGEKKSIPFRVQLCPNRSSSNNSFFPQGQSSVKGVVIKLRNKYAAARMKPLSFIHQAVLLNWQIFYFWNDQLAL